MKIIIIPSLLSFGVIILLFSISLSLFSNNDANAQELKPNAIIFPTCGAVTGYKMTLNVNGFEPNSNVGWKLVHPETQASSEFGYFSTKSTGGFSEPVYIEEGELVEGKYNIQFFDDADNDGSPDSGKREFIVSMSVPCE
jgi:hypothetical protein